ncbi:MAG: 1-acyl-sn-glycerol-3-phosphate acyltransferase [Chitinophagales bacterium]
MYEFKDFFTRKHVSVPFRGRKMIVWNRWYWFVQPPLVSIPYTLYYSKFQKLNWEKVPKNKPVIFAETHRNAFMDSLACVNTGSSQVIQLARGDAFNNKILAPIFYFFHMLPIWRERDEPGGDTWEKNEETFNACYDLLAKNAIVGIYPEGDCINENHVRPLKKGICRIAFGAEVRYNFELDIQIVPVGVTYTGADKFKKWAVINFGDPIPVKDFIPTYKTSHALAINQLKEAIEIGMQKTTLHIKKTAHFHDKEQLATIYARNKILTEGRRYEPISKLLEEKKTINILENAEVNAPDTFKHLHDFLQEYKGLMNKFNFRENTFDEAKHKPVSIVFMTLYLLLMLPVFLFGVVTNYVPYIIPHRFVVRKIKQRIFHSSIKYVIGFPIMIAWYILLSVSIWFILGSMLSVLIFFIFFPIAGHIAFYYWYDLKKYVSILRFKRLERQKDNDLHALQVLRNKIIDGISGLPQE